MSGDNRITVDELLVTPFSIRSEEEKSRIFADGRPTPLIKALSVLLTKETSQESSSQGKLNVYDELKLRRQQMSFTAKSLYEDITWLTASATTQNFYCWPCMLFQFQKPGVWNVSGMSDVSQLRAAAEEHKLTVKHVDAMYQYQMYTDANVKKNNRPSDCDKINLDVIKRLTDVISTLASMQLPPKKLNNCLSELDTKQCINGMELLRKYDNISKNSSDEAIDLLKNSPYIIINVMKAVAQTMRQAIIREMDSCKYVSMIFNQHSNVKLKAQISTVLRYVANGRVRERFVEFSHLFTIATVESLYAHVMRIAREFNIESKCIALSLDGAVLYHGDVNKLIQPCHYKFRRCLLVPCHSHTVDEVLQKSLSSASLKFQSFFKIMADFHACFWNQNSEFNAAFDRYCTSSKTNPINISPRISSSDWFVAPDFICCVQKHRGHFMLFLEDAVSNDSKLSVNDITKAIGFREYLSDYLTVFLLGFFSDIFCLTSTLNAALSDHSPERIVDDQMVPKLLRSLTAMKGRDFERLLSDVAREIGEASKVKENLFTLFMEALNVVMGEVEMRYSDVHKFKFCRLFDFEARGWFEETSNRYKNLTQVYETGYDIPQTLCEMELVSKHGAFSKESVYDFHQYLHESNFKQAFGALFDFSELILALPFKPASPTKEPSIKDKIDKWSFGSADENKLHYGDICIIFVESEDLLEMKQSPTFYDQVLANMPPGPFLDVLPIPSEI